MARGGDDGSTPVLWSFLLDDEKEWSQSAHSRCLETNRGTEDARFEFRKVFSSSLLGDEQAWSGGARNRRLDENHKT